VARIRLIHWNGPEGRERRRRLASLGYEAEFDDLDGSALLRAVRASPPNALLIDLSRLPSHGRETALAVRTSKATRHVPLVFVDGDPAKVAALKTLLPDATYTTWQRLETTLPKALARPAATPIVPPASIYSGKPVVDKLGVKAGMTVAVLNAPKGIAARLAPLPPDVTLSARPASGTDLYLVFVRNQRELAAQLATLGRTVARQTVWLIWPKTASGEKTDLNGNVVRDSGLAAGLVDYKVCSVDDTWSGLAFKRRKES
jgi:CheY-like chemotaxis protein